MEKLEIPYLPVWRTQAGNPRFMPKDSTGKTQSFIPYYQSHMRKNKKVALPRIRLVTLPKSVNRYQEETTLVVKEYACTGVKRISK